MSFPRTSSFPTVCTFASHVFWTRNPNIPKFCIGSPIPSTQQRQAGSCWTSPQILAWTSEPLCLGPNPSFWFFLFVVLTTTALNSPSYRSGNLGSTILSSATFSTVEKGFWRNRPWTLMLGLATLWRRAKHKFTPQVVKDILASERFQNRLELWDRIPKPGSKPPRCYARVLGVLPFAMHFVVLATTFRSPIVLCPYRHSMHPSTGGKESQHLALPPWKHRGPLVLTFKSLSNNSFANGTFRFWLTRFLATSPHSRPSLSNMLRFLISSATTNRPSRCDLPISTSSAAARIGLSTRKHPSIRVTLTGYYQDPYLQAFFLKNLPSLRRALFWTRCSRPRRIIKPPSPKAYGHGPIATAFRPWSMPRNHVSDLAHLLWQQHTNHLTHHITKSTINAV